MRGKTPVLVVAAFWALGCWTLAGHAAEVILNEYNAVSGSKMLDDGGGADSFFGTIDGNGGNWFELLVIEDHTDMRGWTLTWNEDETIENGTDTARGTLSVGDDSLWADLRSGTILTFVETVDGGGESEKSTATDVSYDPENDDWWINVATEQEQAKGASALVTTTTNDGQPGDFSVGKDDWTLEIFNASGTSVFGPVGEGADTWPAGVNVNSEEGGSLEIPELQSPLTLDEWRAITPASSFYDDTGSTSFGAPNVDYDTENEVFTTTQDLSALRSLVGGIDFDGDFNDDGQLTAADIDLLSAAVRDGGDLGTYDVDQDGTLGDGDREAWVEALKKTWFGDSNLDGAFTTGDLVAVFQLGKYERDEAAGWAAGDWSGDNRFGTGDLVLAFQKGGFEKGQRGAVAAVPEPGSALLTMLALLGLGLYRRPSR